MCVGVDAVVRLANISAEEFEDKYAYSTTPVIVTDATHGWKALKVGGDHFKIMWIYDKSRVLPWL